MPSIRLRDGSGSIKYEMCRAEGGDCLPGNRHVHFFCEMCHRTECITDVKIPVEQLPLRGTRCRVSTIR